MRTRVRRGTFVYGPRQVSARRQPRSSIEESFTVLTNARAGRTLSSNSPTVAGEDPREAAKGSAMACGEKTEVEEKYWTWCRKWKIPYPCRKSRTVTKYRYDFMPTRTRVTWPFRCRYEGCCGASLYGWTHWCWRGTGNGPWDHFNTITRYFNDVQYPIGECPFTDGGQIG